MTGAGVSIGKVSTLRRSKSGHAHVTLFGSRETTLDRRIVRSLQSVVKRRRNFGATSLSVTFELMPHALRRLRFAAVRVRQTKELTVDEILRGKI